MLRRRQRAERGAGLRVRAALEWLRQRSCDPAEEAARQSVTGKAQQMAPVVYEFVDVFAANERGCALLSTDEIDRQQKDESWSGTRTE